MNALVAAVIVAAVTSIVLAVTHLNSQVIIALVAAWLGGAIGFFVFALLSAGKDN